MKKEPKVKKHDDRPDLTGEHPWGDLGQLICLAIFILVWIVDIFVFKISEQDYLFIPKGLLISFGGIILILGLYLGKKNALA